MNVEAVVGMANMVFEDDTDKVQIISDIANECAGHTDTDRCDASAKISKCVHNMAMAKGLDFDV